MSMSRIKLWLAFGIEDIFFVVLYMLNYPRYRIDTRKGHCMSHNTMQPWFLDFLEDLEFVFIFYVYGESLFLKHLEKLTPFEWILILYESCGFIVDNSRDVWIFNFLLDSSCRSLCHGIFSCSFLVRKHVWICEKHVHNYYIKRVILKTQYKREHKALVPIII
jgi:hypothetical protein